MICFGNLSSAALSKDRCYHSNKWLKVEGWRNRIGGVLEEVVVKPWREIQEIRLERGTGC